MLLMYKSFFYFTSAYTNPDTIMSARRIGTRRHCNFVDIAKSEHARSVMPPDAALGNLDRCAAAAFGRAASLDTR